MSQVIIYESNGGVSICYPTGEIPITEVLTKDCPPGALIVEQTSLPTSYMDFFSAWELHPDNTVRVSITKARDITKHRIREERKPLLAELDIAFQRALETGASTASIVAEKQRLRDLTITVDSISTLEELRAFKCQ